MNNNKLVSVIITSYNQRIYLNKCIVSVLKTSYPKIEVIIIDDFSRNEEFSESEVVELIKSNSQENLVRYKVIINDKNLGHSNSINKCVEITQGDHFIYVNGDDELPEKALELLYEKHQQGEYILVGGHLASILIDDTVNFPELVSPQILDLSNKEIFNRIIDGSPLPFPLPGSMIKKSDFIEIGRFEKNFKYLEDWQFFLKVFYGNKKVAFINEITYFHRNYSGVFAKKIRNEYYKLSKDFFDSIDWIISNFDLDSATVKKLKSKQKLYSLQVDYFSIEKLISIKFLVFVTKNFFGLIRYYFLQKILNGLKKVV